VYNKAQLISEKATGRSINKRMKKVAKTNTIANSMLMTPSLIYADPDSIGPFRLKIVHPNREKLRYALNEQ
jgi:hypothetical protein